MSWHLHVQQLSGWFQGCLTTLALLTALAASLEFLTTCTSSSAQYLVTQGGSSVTQGTLKPPQEVRLKTSDGWIIVGDRYLPSNSARGAIVLLHQRGGTAADWQPLATALQQAGFTVLAIDQRGAGRSTQGPGPTGDNAPWQTTGDIAAAIASLPMPLPIGLAGASYGANNALIYAASHHNQVKALALFSPGANYHGLDALAAAHSYRGALVIYHDRDDTIPGSGPQQINALVPSQNHKLLVFNGTAHGTGLLEPKVIHSAVNFFLINLKS
ncbi:MAG: alpha/beta fold hydrolase [Chroococcidiopsidaceae cyanobacterium CP_BM_ER_R8_30]|nr:alpha/beta fold hydrolase [Chroococcidiopsidaceae cyanobacterium CP_BM_ER_R8_30]